MARSILVLILAAAPALAQYNANTYNVRPSGGSVGQVCFYETAANGSNKVCLSAAAALSGDVTFKWPTGDGSAGQAITTDGSGQLSWSSVGSPPFSDVTPIIKDDADVTKELLFSIGGFTTATQRTVTVPDASFIMAGRNVDNAFSANQTFGAHVLFGSASAYDIGDATNYAQTLYVENISAAPSGVTGNYVKARKFEIADNAGGTTLWDFQVSQVGGVHSFYYVRDNAGTVVHRLVQLESVSSVNEAQFMFSLVPGNGTTNADNTYDVGTATRSWRNGQFDGTLTTNNLTVTGTCTGCASVPFADSSAIVKGSVDATKLLRFEVDGFTTATTRVMTPPNADATLAGINLAQTWTATQTMQHIQFPAASTYDIGTSTNYGQTLYIENIDAAPSSVTANYTKVRKLEITDASGGTNFWDVQVNQQGAVSSNLLVRDNAGTTVFRLVQVEALSTINQAQFLLHLVPGNNSTNADNTYDLGSAARSWRTAYLDTSIVIGGSTFVDASRNTTVNNLTIAGTCTGCGGGGYNLIQEEAANLTARTTLNFVGAALTAADAGTKTTVTLSQSPASASVVGTGRTISTTSPLTGGGDLSADRTFACSDCATLSTTQTFTGVKTFSNQVQMTSTFGTGTILPLSDNTYDLGGSGIQRFRTIYFGTSLNQGFTTRIDSSGNGSFGNVVGSGYVQAGSYFSQSGTIRIDINGRGIFTNVNVTGSLVATPASGYAFYVNGTQVRVRFSDGTDKEVSLL